MASWLVHLLSDQAVRVQALTRDFVLCSWARTLTLAEPLSSSRHINGSGHEFKARGTL